MLAAAGYIAKIRYEKKRTLRTTLYYLLQLRQSAVMDELLVTELPERVISAFNSVLADHSWQLTDAEKDFMVREARPILVTVAERQSAAEQQEVRSQLLRALSELAKDQPILAYRLSAALPDLKLPDGASDVRPTDFPAEVSGIAETISRSIQIGFHAEGARQLKRKLSRLIHMASFEVGVLPFIETYLVLRKQDNAKMPDSFFEAIAKPMAASIQVLILALESAAAAEAGGLEADEKPRSSFEPVVVSKLPPATRLEESVS